MHTLSLSDEVKTIRELVLKPKIKTPESAWETFIAYMTEKHGVSDIDSPEGRVYLAQFDQYPGMKALLDYMMRRAG